VFYWPHNSVFEEREHKSYPMKRKSGEYEAVKDKTFDEIVREISRLTKKKKQKTTTTTTTEAPVTSGVEDDYDYDDDEPQGDEADETVEDTGHQQIYPNKNQYQADAADAYNPGDLTSLKMKQLGTPDAVRNSMRQHIEAQRKKDQNWEQHYMRSMRESKCKIPKPQVFPSSSDPSKIYVPRCTVLYRCSDDTACCPSADKTCVADKYEWVELDFRVSIPFNGTSMSVTHLFLNHTSCHCVEKSIYHRTKAPDPITRPDDSCHCPSSFNKVYEGSNCKCEFTCTSDCMLKREGQEYFNMEERGCISRGLCKRPPCNYGHYKLHEGRCPKRDERIAGVIGRGGQQSQHKLF